MLSAPLAYQVIARDMPATIARVASQPLVARDSEYYLANIGKVESIEEFLGDHRLYSYAMKAYGLEDMTYAKAFMRKVLESDLADPASFANKLVDKRYQEFALAFSFQTPEPQSSAGMSDVLSRYAEIAGNAGLGESAIRLIQMNYSQNVTSITSVDDLLDSDSVLDVALTAYGLASKGNDKEFLRKLLTSDLMDPDSFANSQTNADYRAFAEAFNFGTQGNVRAQTQKTAEATRDAFIRQTLELDAGLQNEGVRLALYFERKVGTIGSVFSILADPALLKVAQTALGLPASMSNANIDAQAAMLEERLDLPALRSPEGLQKFITRFTAMWELANPSAPAVSPTVLITQPGQISISADTLMTLQGLRLGGR